MHDKHITVSPLDRWGSAMSPAGFVKLAEAQKPPQTGYLKSKYETKHLASSISYAACICISSLYHLERPVSICSFFLIGLGLLTSLLGHQQIISAINLSLTVLIANIVQLTSSKIPEEPSQGKKNKNQRLQ